MNKCTKDQDCPVHMGDCSLPMEVEFDNEHDYKFVHRMMHELEHNARHRFPENKFQFMALAEEFGELAQALFECERGDAGRHGTDARNAAIRHVYDEAIQVAVMAMRVATEGDADMPAYIPKIGDRTFEWRRDRHGTRMNIVEQQ